MSRRRAGLLPTPEGTPRQQRHRRCRKRRRCWVHCAGTQRSSTSISRETPFLLMLLPASSAVLQPQPQQHRVPLQLMPWRALSLRTALRCEQWT